MSTRIDLTFLDEQQLETTAKPKAAVTEGRRATGGDRPNPRARSMPR